MEEPDKSVMVNDSERTLAKIIHEAMSLSSRLNKVYDPFKIRIGTDYGTGIVIYLDDE
jgi:hypothetical protein